MDEPFDPYYKWLGISPAEQPPNHYRLLGINLFENDPDVIESAADRQMAHVRTFQSGPHSEDSQRLLNQLASARVCLLSAQKKAAYDAQLWVALTAKTEGWQASGPPLEYHVKGAARYLWIQARRFWLRWLRLPAVYQVLGEDVYRQGRLRGPLGDLFQRLESVSGRLETLETSAEVEPTPRGNARRGLWARAMAMLGRASLQVRVALAGRKRRSLLARIGRAAYELEGRSSGPVQLVEPIAAAEQRLAQLGGEAAQLAVVPAGQVLSPRRLAWALLVIVGFPILLFFWSLLGILF